MTSNIMNRRWLLESQIAQAWHDCISKDYSIQRINSERSLQASFWSRLNALLSKNRRMFIEPCMTIKTNGHVRKIFPDLVICNTREVIGIVELKYMPRATPNYKKDINSLSIIAKHREHITISNERYRGQAVDKKIYTLSKSILFVWAGVHTGINSTIPKQIDELPYSAGHKELEGCFIEPHAETNKNSGPKIYKRS